MIAIIPARRGSKGLPGKNILPLCGKPLLAYTVESAIGCKSISEVVISTDDAEINEVACRYGAKSYFLRPPELATDDSLAIDTYKHTVDKLNLEYNFKISEFVVLLPTSPLRTSLDISNSIDIFLNNNADSVISFAQEDRPLSWHKRISPDLRVLESNSELVNRQDEQVSFFPNGSIYIFKRELLDRGKYYTDKSYAYIMPKDRSVDIDTKNDFEFAEFLMEKRNAL